MRYLHHRTCEEKDSTEKIGQTCEEKRSTEKNCSVITKDTLTFDHERYVGKKRIAIWEPDRGIRDLNGYKKKRLTSH